MYNYELITLLEKVFKVLDFLNKSSYIDNVYDINVEDNLSGFAGGRTSQQTIVKLAKFNAVLCFVLEDMLEMEVHNINPVTARKNVFGKARVKGIKAKDFVKMKIEEMFEFNVHSINPMTARKQVFGKARVKGIKAKDLVKMKIEEMYDTSKWCKTTTRGNWDKRNIDMYDGLVISLFGDK